VCKKKKKKKKRKEFLEISLTTAPLASHNNNMPPKAKEGKEKTLPEAEGKLRPHSLKLFTKK